MYSAPGLGRGAIWPASAKEGPRRTRPGAAGAAVYGGRLCDGAGPELDGGGVDPCHCAELIRQRCRLTGSFVEPSRSSRSAARVRESTAANSLCIDSAAMA